jgi:Protein of unknown function (DUF2865)
MSLERGGGGRPRSYDRAIQQQRVDLERTFAYYQNLGCEQRVGLFGSQPPQCASLSSRINRMEANYNALLEQADRGDSRNESRRRQLMAAIDAVCREQTRGALERLFGGSARVQVPPPVDMDLLPPEPDEDSEVSERRYTRRRPVCVRTCDGYFFPLLRVGENAEETCRALCPNTETTVFYLGGDRDGNITNAVNSSGESYSSLVNAGAYLRSFNPNCGCRGKGESWASVLQTAEDTLERRRSDVLVTEQAARQLSLPSQAAVTRSKRKKQSEEDLARENAAAAISGAQAPTAGRDSAGIEPNAARQRRIVGTDEGKREEVQGENGLKRSIRVLVPSPMNL